MYYPFSYDSTCILVLIGVVISMIASTKLDSTYQRYSSVRSICGLTGAEVAQKPLSNQGVYDVIVHRVVDNLTDHYDPRTKIVNLLDSVYGSASIAAIGVATHEYGHAMQDTSDYPPLRTKAALVPTANLDSGPTWPLILVGPPLGGSSSTSASIGILLLLLAVLFQLVTLPVEYNASHRAMTLLDSAGVLFGQRMGQTRNVLSATVLIHVATVAAPILQLLRLLTIFGN